MSAIAVTENNFQNEVLDSNVPVLVDFWAEWCGPCKMVAPILDEIAVENSGKLKVAKVDVDQAKELAAQFNVMSIPTLVVFKGGQVVDQLVGALPKDQIMEKVTPHLG